QCHGLASGRGPELAVNAPHVGLDGVLRDVQRAANLALRKSAGQEPEHGQLALGQLFSSPGGSRGSATVRAVLGLVQDSSEAPWVGAGLRRLASFAESRPEGRASAG